jgi:hypothetical protein
LLSRLKEKTDTISRQQEEIESLKESEGILSSDIIRLETENDDLRRKEREDSAVRERLQQQFEDALERFVLFAVGCSMRIQRRQLAHISLPSIFPCSPP